MWQQIVDLAHNEIVAYLGMMLILSAFFLETRDILNSKEWPYLVPVSYTHLTLPTTTIV